MNLKLWAVSLVISFFASKNQSSNTFFQTTVQEHTVYFITRLLSPPVPAGYCGKDSHLICYAPMLNVLLVGIAPVDCVQIFSLHGMVCEVLTKL